MASNKKHETSRPPSGSHPYYLLNRNWTFETKASRKIGARDRNNMSNMERWLDQDMTEQPYNTVRSFTQTRNNNNSNNNATGDDDVENGEVGSNKATKSFPQSKNNNKKNAQKNNTNNAAGDDDVESGKAGSIKAMSSISQSKNNDNKEAQKHHQ